jgi:cytochrome P450
MTTEEIAGTALLLVVAGHETTANMIALGAAALITNPGQRELFVAADAVQTANAVEELLRYLTITHSGRRRVALTDLHVREYVIPAGEGFIGANDIANRDPRVFEDPDRLDLTRNARDHLTFGYGVHQCLGHAIARMELQVALGTLFRRIPSLDLAVPIGEVEFKDDMSAYGVHALPVTW